MSESRAFPCPPHVLENPVHPPEYDSFLWQFPNALISQHIIHLEMNKVFLGLI